MSGYGLYMPGVQSGLPNVAAIRSPQNAPDMSAAFGWTNLAWLFDADDPATVQKMKSGDKIINSCVNPATIKSMWSAGISLSEADVKFNGHNAFALDPANDWYTSQGLTSASYTLFWLAWMDATRYQASGIAFDTYYLDEYDPSVNAFGLTVRYDHTTPQDFIVPKASTSFPPTGSTSGSSGYTGAIPAAGVVGLRALTYDAPTKTSKYYIDDMVTPKKTTVHTVNRDVLTTTRYQLFNVFGSNTQGMKGGCSLIGMLNTVADATQLGQIKTITDFRR